MTAHRALSSIAYIIIALVLIALPSQAGTELSPEGRRIATGPKSIQQSVDGFDLQLIDQSSPAPGRVLSQSGRSLRAGPTQPVSVGIIGCPGCQTESLLEELRPYIFVPAGN